MIDRLEYLEFCTVFRSTKDEKSSVAEDVKQEQSTRRQNTYVKLLDIAG